VAVKLQTSREVCWHASYIFS